MGLMFDKDEILQLTVEAYRPAAAAIPFGSARISIPKEGYTYQPGNNVDLVTLGGNENQCADPKEVVTSPLLITQESTVYIQEDATTATCICLLFQRNNTHKYLPVIFLSERLRFFRQFYEKHQLIFLFFVQTVCFICTNYPDFCTKQNKVCTKIRTCLDLSQRRFPSFRHILTRRSTSLAAT